MSNYNPSGFEFLDDRALAHRQALLAKRITPSFSIRDAIQKPMANLLVATQWCPACQAMQPHANLCPGCYPFTGGSHIGQSRPCSQCYDQLQASDALRLWCVDCGHEGTPYPTYEQDGQTLLDQPDERAICAACHDPIDSPPMVEQGIGPLHATCALRIKMAGVVPSLLAYYEDRREEVPADAEARYQRHHTPLEF